MKKIKCFKPKLIPTLFTIPALILLLSLSIWQFYRLNWKQELIDQINQQIQLPVITLPEQVDLGSMLYRKVKLKGKLLNDHEMYLYGGSIEFKGQNGYYILTPLRLESGQIVIVNRGWVPDSLKDPNKRLETLIDSAVEITGSIMKNEDKGIYVHDNQPDRNLWFYINLDEMKSYLNLPIQDFYILSEFQPNVIPIGRNVTPNLRNNHLGYALTWLIAAISLIFIYIMYHRESD